MHRYRRSNDAAQWYLNEMGARIVASSGNPQDRFHLGKLVLQGLKDAPDFVTQIDGATDDSETNASLLERSIRCAISFKALGLNTGDVIILMAPNHIDLAIPFYAALYLGVIVAAVDRTLTVAELQNTFSVDNPKLIFCQSEKAPDIQVALNKLDLDSQIITFDKGDYLCSFSEFLDKYAEDFNVDDFQPSDFDPEDAVALLIATSGTTGLPKAAASTHKNLAISGAYWWGRFTDFPTPTRLVLVGSPLQWLTALMNFIFAPIMRYTRLQSSLTLTREHAYHLINTYKPSYMITSPTMMTSLIKPPDRYGCDFTCFDIILLGGSAVPTNLFGDIKAVTPNTEVRDAYGMSEVSGLAFHVDDPPIGSSGRPIGGLQYRLVDVVTQEDVVEPNQPGELWLKGPEIFKEYYNNPDATEETFAEDRWFKTGDIFYRDEHWYFFFVERYKLLLKYNTHQISPVEVENVIRQHPGVLDVAVTGIPDPECGDLLVACVVKHPDYRDVSAQDIKDFVKDSLTDSKQLRGGVIFINEIPMTASTKVHRRKLKELALNMERE